METTRIEIQAFSATETLGMLAKGIMWYVIGFAGIPALLILLGCLS